MKTAALDLARERQAHEAGARTRATAHERTPQQERQKAAREAERGREAWTLGQGMKKPVAGCYGRLTRWKGVTNGAIVIHTQRLKSDPGGNLLS
ncbi:relaxase [Escherichia coli]|nr:relaxase [Escherichia coli]